MTLRGWIKLHFRRSYPSCGIFRTGPRETHAVLGDDLFPAGTVLVTPVRVALASRRAPNYFFSLVFLCVKMLSSLPAIQRKKEGRRAGARKTNRYWYLRRHPAETSSPRCARSKRTARSTVRNLEARLPD